MTHRDSRPLFGRQQYAFTLIELLVVIGLIILIAALLFPALSRSIARAHVTKCQSNISQITKAYIMYMHDHDGNRPFLLPIVTALASVRWTDNRIMLDGAPSGLGVFIEEGYLQVFDNLWCPAVPIPGKYNLEFANWTNNATANGAYLYHWFLAPELPADNVFVGNQSFWDWLATVSNHDFQFARGWHALVMDVNTDQVFSGVPFRSHRKLNRINIGYLDGHVRMFDSRGELLIPVGFPAPSLVAVWKKAHELHSAQ